MDWKLYTVVLTVLARLQKGCEEEEQESFCKIPIEPCFIFHVKQLLWMNVECTCVKCVCDWLPTIQNYRMMDGHNARRI